MLIHVYIQLSALRLLVPEQAIRPHNDELLPSGESRVLHVGKKTNNDNDLVHRQNRCSSLAQHNLRTCTHTSDIVTDIKDHTQTHAQCVPAQKIKSNSDF